MHSERGSVPTPGISTIPAFRTCEELKNEVADVLYHLFVLLHDRGVSIEEVKEVLSERHKKSGNFKGERNDIKNW